MANKFLPGGFLPPKPSTGSGGGSVNSVTAGDGTITVGGTATDPTVAVTQSNAFAWTNTQTWAYGTGTNTMTLTDAAVNTQVDVLKVRKATSGTATAGIGASLTLGASDGAGTMVDSVRVIGMNRTVTAGSVNAVFLVQGLNAGSYTNLFHATAGQLYAPSSVNLGVVSATGVTTTSATWLVTGAMVAYQSASASNGGHSFTGTANTSGARQFFVITPSANTASTAGTEIKKFQYAAYTQTWATGAITTQREFAIEAPTYAFAGASTISDAATLYVSGAPIAGSNATITRGYSLWTDDGDVRHDNIGVALGGGASATMGTIGGSGPTTAAQNKWARMNIDGTVYWFPVWV